MIGFVVSGDPPRGESVGARLRRLRLAQGASQRDLSSPGITYAYISRIEAGARQPSVKALRMLATKLGVTPEYLETGTDLGGAEIRELRIAEQELRLRLDGAHDGTEVATVLAESEASADVAAAARARIVLGLAAAERGDHPEAVSQLEHVIDRDSVTPSTQPDVYATLGHSYAASGSPHKAVTLFERALADLEPGNLAARVRYSTYLSYALTDLGELQRAQAVLAGMFDQQPRADDRYGRVRMHWSLGRLALERAQPLTALESFRRAIALLETTENTVHLARAHVACAEAILSGGSDHLRARRHLAEAERLLAPEPGRDDLATIRRMQSICALEAGETAEAERLGVEALELAREHPNELGHAWWALAEARARADRSDAGEAYGEAVSLLEMHGTVRQHANLLRAYGRYLRASGEERAALDVFERAAEVAANLQGEATTAER